MKKALIAFKDFLLMDIWDCDLEWWFFRIVGSVAISLLILLLLFAQGYGKYPWSVMNMLFLYAITFGLACWIGR